MRIMLVNTYYYPEIVGGAEYSVKKLAEGLKKAGHSVIVLCTGDETVRETINGIDVIRIKADVSCRAIRISNAPAYQKLISRIKGIWNKGNEKTIKRILEQETPDVIHTNGLYDISPIIWKVAKKQNIRVVHTLRDYYLCCPLVSMECEIQEKKCRFKNNLCPLHRTANKKALRKYVDCITAPSSITLNKVLTALDSEYLSSKVIPNAIDYEENEVLRNLDNKRNRENDVIKFVYLGALSEKKGVLWMLKSFSHVESNKAELYIAGKGELEDIVKEYCLKEKRAHFVGFLEEKDMNQLLAQMDVLICPSLWDEPFGRVVLDAYKNALPVIASDRGALPENVENYLTGVIIRAGDSKQLSSSIAYYCENREHLEEQRKNAVKKIAEYSIDKQVLSFVETAYSEMKK